MRLISFTSRFRIVLGLAGVILGIAGSVELMLHGTGWTLLASSLLLSAPVAADLLPVLWAELPRGRRKR